MANIDKITLRGVNYSIIDSSVPSYVKGITQTDITNWNNKLDSFTETDPSISSYLRAITEQDISNWNNKLDSFTETDPTVPSHVKSITQQNISNWNSKVSYDSRWTDAAVISSQAINLVSSKAAPDFDEGIIFNDINKIFTGTNLKSTVSGNNTDYKFTREVNGDVAVLSDIPDISSYVSKSELNSAGYLTSFTETDPTVPSHVKSITEQNITNWNTAHTNSHTHSNKTVIDGITSTDISNWNSKTDNVGTITGITMNGASKGTSGVVDLGTVLTEHQSLSSYATSANYDSSTKKIYLKHGTTTLSEIDATDFIKDGMVDTAYVQGANLVISFNTDAGKEAVNVPISDIFNANNYYTKSEIDNASYLQWDEKSSVGQNTDTLSMNRLYIETSSDTDIPLNGHIAFTDNNRCFNGFSICDYQADYGDSVRYSFTRDVKGDVAITNDITKAINSYVISASYLQSFTETDPTVPTHVKSITQQNINDWNNKLSAETQLSKGTTTGSGNAVTDISVSNHQITLTKGSTFLTAHQDIKTINNQTITGTGNVTINELPTVSSSDNGKVLQVVNGIWTLVTPLHLYSGTGTPDNSQGNNGDLYMQI